MRLYILAAAILLVFSSAAQGEEISKIIVKVNNQVITSRDLDEYCKVLAYRLFDGSEEVSGSEEEFKAAALERLIEDTLILDKAKREGIEISRFRIEDKMSRLISSHPSREEFEKSLIDKGLTIALLRKKIEEQYMLRDIIDKYVKSRISVLPKEISSYYSQHPDEFYSPLEYVFYIAKSTDNSILKKISRVIKEEGILEAQAQYDDMLMKIESNKNELRVEISEMLEGLDIGKYRIKKIDDKFYLLLLDGKVFPQVLSLGEVKEGIHAYLWDVKFREKFSLWVDELKEDAVVKSYYEYP